MVKLALLVLFVTVFASTKSVTSVDECRLYSSTCSTCIQHPDCAWNFEESSKQRDDRCFEKWSFIAPAEKVYNPKTHFDIEEAEELDDTVHIKPQRIVDMHLRPNELTVLEVQIKSTNSTTIELVYTAPDFFNVSFLTDCKRATTAGNKCEDVENGKVYTFRVVIIGKCPTDKSKYKDQIIEITHSESNQTLTIEVAELFCSCDCIYSVTERAKKCQSHGNLMCGVCDCNPGYSGRYCECEGRVNPNDCTNPYNRIMCSGRGTCVCGECTCDARSNPEEVISGKYCECDNFSCEKHKGKLCGGEDRGICVCGICQCNEGWSGADCSCSAKSETCLPPDSGLSCNGNGACVCDTCDCFPGFTGRYCQTGSTS